MQFCGNTSIVKTVDYFNCWMKIHLVPCLWLRNSIKKNRLKSSTHVRNQNLLIIRGKPLRPKLITLTLAFISYTSILVLLLPEFSQLLLTVIWFPTIGRLETWVQNTCAGSSRIGKWREKEIPNKTGVGWFSTHNKSLASIFSIFPYGKAK